MPKKRRSLTDLLDESAAEQWRDIPPVPTVKAPSLKVSRDVRSEPWPGMPWPETREFRVDTRLDYKGGVVLSWTSGTKKRGNCWEMRLSLKEIKALEAIASSVRIEGLEHDLRVAELEAHCWRELLRAEAPDRFDTRGDEVQTFMAEGPASKRAAKGRRK